MSMYHDHPASREEHALLGNLASADYESWTPLFVRTPASAHWKRSFDIAASIAFLVFVLPLLVTVALLIWIESGGPVLFRQRRTGWNGKIFTILKFRTMFVAEDGDQIAHATKGDARVTRVGGFLRASSIDELPQLINVLRGDMSMVGPRPHALAHDAHYGALLPGYNDRFAVRPGITGLAQVQGLRGEIRELACMANRIEADVDYAKGWSFRDDLVILFRTLPVLLSRQNAY